MMDWSSLRVRALELLREGKSAEELAGELGILPRDAKAMIQTLKKKEGHS